MTALSLLRQASYRELQYLGGEACEIELKADLVQSGKVNDVFLCTMRIVHHIVCGFEICSDSYRRLYSCTLIEKMILHETSHLNKGMVTSIHGIASCKITFK